MKTVAMRRQIPLKLAFSLTIHKSQGMTIECLEVNAANMFLPGQLGVAVGRAVNKEGLRIINYEESSCAKANTNINDFYQRITLAPDINMECCSKIRGAACADSDDPDNLGISDKSDPSDSDFSEGELDEIDLMMSVEVQDDAQTDELSPPVIDLIDLPDKLVTYNPVTEYQSDMNKVATDFRNKESTIIYLKAQYDVLHNMLRRNCPSIFTDEHESTSWKQFFTSFNSYTTSFGHSQKVRHLFDNQHPTEIQKHTAIRLLQFIRERILGYYSQEIVKKQEQANESHDNASSTTCMSSGGEGKVRYVGGRAVAKTKYHYSKLVQNNVSKIDNLSQDATSKAYRRFLLLDSLTATEIQLQNSTHPESLKETFRKQNMRHGLTNITDKAYGFFMELVEIIARLENTGSLQVYGPALPDHVKSQILHDSKLYESWVANFQSCKVTYDKPIGSNDEVAKCLENVLQNVECIDSIFTDVTKSFLNVYHNELRRKYMSDVRRKRKSAHRKQITKAKCFKSCKPSLTDIKNDQSQNKTVSHYQLKACIEQDSECFVDRVYTNKDLKIICKAYLIPFRAADTKGKLCEKLVKGIKTSDKINCPEVFGLQQAQEASTRVETQPPISVPGTSTQMEVEGDILQVV